MKRTKFIITLVAICFTLTSYGQQILGNGNFHGAVAILKSYKALYVINQSDGKKIKALVRNINNALADPRLKGKLEVELVAFGDGVEIFRKTNQYDTLLIDLQKKGVLLAECENTIKERKISNDDLWSFISYVPSGNGEIIIRQAQGWSVIHP